ncbi:hypothetical protein N7E02_00815 (plasmid) [Aliirhizobium terrae]|uniref:hypothetical protein n=1 Tax=Terrirhizobium terrae TaxID=2926709 RepID=UPI002575885E|nr:hypothetical protein [Rhizobium sp. CC-CFT758]WJH37998.1 hypothetical protein N7E02_00815 [Rhizobium sp. CC-CFT758]
MSDDQGAAVEGPIGSRAERVSVAEASNSDELTGNPAELSSPGKVSERKLPVTPRKARSPHIAVEQAAETAENEALEAASGAKTLFDEMAELDAEISSLRKQLSEKLIAQNEQLRKMVQRFDRI